MNYINFILYSLVWLIFTIIFYIIGVALHEAGHLVFGLMTGYKFSSYRLLSFVWYKEGGKIKFTKSKSIAVGQCLMIPPENEKKFRFVLYNLGGGIVNIVSLILFIILCIVLPYNLFLYCISLGGVLANWCLMVLNMIPMVIDIPNDGMNVVAALKSKDAKHGLYLTFFVNSETMKGKRYSELDSELLNVSDTADFNNYLVAYIVILEAARLYDLGEYDKSIDCYGKLKNAKLPAYYSNAIKLNYLYYYTVHKPDFEKARELFRELSADKKLKKLLNTQTRILSAYEYIVNGDKNKGRELLQMAKNQLQNYPNKGARLMETDYCAKLEEILV
jgi:hypothetical protein